MPDKGDWEPQLADLRQKIVNLQEDSALATLQELLSQGAQPWDLMHCFNESLGDIGRMFQEGTYYMTGLILAGEIMRQAMNILMPYLAERKKENKRGLIIIGTIEGDIHDLGKNMAAWFLEADGFEVVDLGVDVPPRVFLREILQREPDAVGISLLLISCVEPVKRLVKLLRDAYDDRPPPPVFVGCGFMSSISDENSLLGQQELERKWLDVEHVVNDAYDTLRLCRELVSRKGRVVS
jgi:methanogenic corrinoid protein MtbC1